MFVLVREVSTAESSSSPIVAVGYEAVYLDCRVQCESMEELADLLSEANALQNHSKVTVNA